jgi:2-polyprenyl-3-methyl-5-hydroxy-6-metoxy-1,4-benzoquinol methylase
MNPQYSDDYLEKYYSDYLVNEDQSYWDEALFYGHNYYLSLVERYCPKGEMLDIGCGNGHLLKAASSRGWIVSGYDVDKKSTSDVAKRLGIDVQSGDFFSIDYADEKFDLVTMHQVLEHVKQPRKYMSKIHSIVKPGGCVFIAVPNIKSASNKLKFFLERLGLRKKNIGKYYDTNHHLLYFEPKTLKGLVEEYGFKIVFQRNGHYTRPNQSKFKRFIMRHFTEALFAKSTFLVIAIKN